MPLLDLTSHCGKEVVHLNESCGTYIDSENMRITDAEIGFFIEHLLKNVAKDFGITKTQMILKGYLTED